MGHLRKVKRAATPYGSSARRSCSPSGTKVDRSNTNISVPVSRVADFIERADAAVKAAMPGIRPVPFGHVGDGNIHFNLTQPVGADQADFLAQWETMNGIVHEIALDLGGSISAEHGIGRFKRDEMRQVKSPVELDMMQRVKAALDPHRLLNPRALLPGDDGDDHQ